MAVPAVQPPAFRGFQPRRFAVAVGTGLALQVVLLAFGLHASLWFADLTESYRLYWAFCGAYLTVGLAAVVLIVPWHRPAVRFAVSFLLVAISFLTAMLFNWSKPIP